MPTIVPLGGYSESSGPVTRRFSLCAGLSVRTRLDSDGLPASVDVGSGEGLVAMCDVVSEVVEEAR